MTWIKKRTIFGKTPSRRHPDIDDLSSIPLFSGLDGTQLQKLGRIARKRSFARNQVVFNQGDEGDGFYVVVEGEVKVFKLSPEGREKILHLFRPFEPIGEAAVFSGQRFPAHAPANRSSRLLFFPRQGFIELGGSDPTILLNMLAILSSRLRRFAEQIESLTLKEVPARLASFLVHLSEEQKNPNGVVLNLSRGQLASLLGTIPETLSRALSRLAGQGLIAVDGRRIDFLNRDELRQAAGALCRFSQ